MLFPRFSFTLSLCQEYFLLSGRISYILLRGYPSIPSEVLPVRAFSCVFLIDYFGLFLTDFPSELIIHMRHPWFIFPFPSTCCPTCMHLVEPSLHPYIFLYTPDCVGPFCLCSWLYSSCKRLNVFIRRLYIPNSFSNDVGLNIPYILHSETIDMFPSVYSLDI